MNYADFFTAPNGFPVESDTTLGFMQTDYQEAIKGLAALCGSNHLIVSGCEDDSINVQSGWMYIDGDLIKFEGGQKALFIVVHEETVQKANQNAVLHDRYTTKTAKFGTGAGVNQIPYSFFVRITNLRDITSLIGFVAKGSLYEGQDWVVIDGLKPNIDNTEILGGVAIYKGQMVRVTFSENQFGSENNPLYLTPNGEWTRTNDPTFLKFTPFTSQRSEVLLLKNQSRKGTVVWFATNKFPALFFEPSGLGKVEWNGWAKADGANNTTDLSSAIPGLIAIQRI